MRDGDRESRFDLKDVFDELMVECRRNGETDQKAEAEVKDKKPLWRKVQYDLNISSSLVVIGNWCEHSCANFLCFRCWIRIVQSLFYPCLYEILGR